MAEAIGLRNAIQSISFLGIRWFARVPDVCLQLCVLANITKMQQLNHTFTSKGTQNHIHLPFLNTFQGTEEPVKNSQTTALSRTWSNRTYAQMEKRLNWSCTIVQDHRTTVVVGVGTIFQVCLLPLCTLATSLSSFLD